MMSYRASTSSAASSIPSSAVVGTTTNNNAAPGILGEYLSAIFSNVSLTSGTVTNIASLGLTAGDWDVSGGVVITGSGAVLSEAVAGSNTVSATLGSAGTYAQCLLSSGAATLIQTWASALPTYRVSIASSTSVHCVGRATFASGTATASGVFRARRVR